MGEGNLPLEDNNVQPVVFNFNKDLSLQIQVGSRLFPEMAIDSSTEAFYQLRKTLGVHVGTNAISINRHPCTTRDFITAVEMEKILGASFSGMNTMSGDLLTIRMKPASGQTIAMTATTEYYLHYVLVYDSILSLGLTRVQVLE